MSTVFTKVWPLDKIHNSLPKEFEKDSASMELD